MNSAAGVEAAAELSGSPARCSVASASGGGQQAVGAPPAPQCPQPGEAAAWWSARSDPITSGASSALQP